MFDFFIGASFGYLLAHIPAARLSSIWATVKSWFTKKSA